MSISSNSIWSFHEVFYIESMLFNTRSAMRSIDVVTSLINYLENSESEDPFRGVDTKGMLNNLQNIIVQGAALSRYFWPVRKEYENRGKELRRALGISESNPLKSRNLRNEMEHFDEKLDRYIARDLVGCVIPEYFGPSQECYEVPIHIFRAYYTDTGKFELLGNSYEVQPIVDEIVRLDTALTKCGKDGGRLFPAAT